MSCKKCGFQATSEAQLWIHEGQHTKDMSKGNRKGSATDFTMTSQPAKRQKLMPSEKSIPSEEKSIPSEKKSISSKEESISSKEETIPSKEKSIPDSPSSDEGE